MKLSEALKEKQGDQSLRQLARDLGVAVGTAEGWVKGWRTPDLKYVPRIARYLEVDVAEVVISALEENSPTGVQISSRELVAA